MRDTAVSAIELGRNSLPPERYAEMADALGADRKTIDRAALPASLAPAGDVRVNSRRYATILAAGIAPPGERLNRQGVRTTGARDQG
jgi:hypothetical protein